MVGDGKRTGSSIVIGVRTKAAEGTCGVVILLAEAAESTATKGHFERCRDGDVSLVVGNYWYATGVR